MPDSPLVVVSAAVEGIVDEAVLRRLLEGAGASLGAVHGKKGKSHLRLRITGYNQAARFSPWVVLIDLDQDAECAPPLRRTWLPDSSPRLCLRIAVRAVEAWILADRERLALFLAVTRASVPQEPEKLPDPKSVLVHLAKHSRRRDIREDMFPRAAGGRRVGPAYSSRLIEFVSDHSAGWRPEVAAGSSESLRRCLASLRALVTA